MGMQKESTKDEGARGKETNDLEPDEQSMNK